MKIAIIAGSAAHFYKTTFLRFVAWNRPFHESAVNNGTERAKFLHFFFYFIFIKYSVFQKCQKHIIKRTFWALLKISLKLCAADLVFYDTFLRCLLRLLSRLSGSRPPLLAPFLSMMQNIWFFPHRMALTLPKMVPEHHFCFRPHPASARWRPARA